MDFCTSLSQAISSQIDNQAQPSSLNKIQFGLVISLVWQVIIFSSLENLIIKRKSFPSLLRPPALDYSRITIAYFRCSFSISFVFVGDLTDLIIRLKDITISLEVRNTQCTE